MHCAKCGSTYEFCCCSGHPRWQDTEKMSCEDIRERNRQEEPPPCPMCKNNVHVRHEPMYFVCDQCATSFLPSEKEES